MEKILVIEDHFPVLENIRNLLEKEGFQVVTAGSGNEGIRLACEEKPDIIICDIMMPEMDGFEVLKQLSANKRTSSIPFVFLTARAEMSDLRQGMDLGADDYLVKPFRAADLIKAVRVRLEKRSNIVQTDNETVPKEPVLKSNSVVFAGNPPEVLKIAEIVYICAIDGYTNVFTRGGKKLMVRKLLKEWMEILPEEQFLRIHKSTIINVECMERVEKWFNNSLRIHMHNISEPLEVSKRFSPKVKARLKI